MFRKHFGNVAEMRALSWDLSFIRSLIFAFNVPNIIFLLRECSYFEFTLNMFVSTFIGLIMSCEQFYVMALKKIVFVFRLHSFSLLYALLSSLHLNLDKGKDE